MQGQGFCHRDIKLGNIFVSNKGVLRVGDLGQVRKNEEYKCEGKRENRTI